MRAFLTGLTVVLALSVAAFAVQPPSSQPHDLRTSSGLASFTSSPALTFAAGHQRQVVAYLHQLRVDQDAVAARLAAIAAARVRQSQPSHRARVSASGDVLDCISGHESDMTPDPWTAYNGAPAGNGHASGRYQVTSGTWNHFGGYDEARDAPPAVQVAQARDLYARNPTAWRGTGCAGTG